MKISEHMHRNADWVSADTPVSEVVKLMKTKDIGAVPVGKDDKLVGMLTDRDIALRMFENGRDPRKATAEEIMSPGIVYCRSDQSIEDAIHMMDQRKIRRLPVLNDKKRMVGMLSLGDISHAVSRDLSGEAIHAVSDHHA